MSTIFKQKRHYHLAHLVPLPLTWHQNTQCWLVFYTKKGLQHYSICRVTVIMPSKWLLDYIGHLGCDHMLPYTRKYWILLHTMMKQGMAGIVQARRVTVGQGALSEMTLSTCPKNVFRENLILGKYGYYCRPFHLKILLAWLLIY